MFCLFIEHHGENPDNSSDAEHDHIAPLDLRAAGLAGVWMTVKSLVTNGPYMFSVLYETFDYIVIEGFTTFGVKYAEQQFGLTASMAGIIFG